MIEFLGLVGIGVVIYYLMKKADTERERMAFVKSVLEDINRLPTTKEGQNGTSREDHGKGSEGSNGESDDQEDL